MNFWPKYIPLRAVMSNDNCSCRVTSGWLGATPLRGAGASRAGTSTTTQESSGTVYPTLGQIIILYETLYN